MIRFQLLLIHTLSSADAPDFLEVSPLINSGNAMIYVLNFVSNTFQRHHFPHFIHCVLASSSTNILVFGHNRRRIPQTLHFPRLKT